MPAAAPRRIVLHPGFHKTGTSSMQHLLWTNRALLQPALGVLLLRHLKPAAEICMHFARHQSPLALTNLVEAMDAIMTEHLPPGDTRDLILSCEGLSGHLPGWPGVDSYVAAPITGAFLAGYFAERVPNAELQIVYSTRAPDDWLYSAWRHHLHGQRLRMDWPAFETAFRPAANLSDIVTDVAKAVDPVQVFDLPIEEGTHHALGLGGALLELIDLPSDIRAQIVHVGQGNTGPDADLAAEFLALNRSNLPDETVRQRKFAMADAKGSGGWAKAPVTRPESRHDQP